MTKEALEKAPMIESDNYRELADPQWMARVREFFATPGRRPALSEDKEPAATSGEGPTTLLRASKVLGATAPERPSENLGSIEDLLLDRNSRVAFAIIGHGGVLGIGENYIPVPWSKLQLSQRPDDAGLVAAIEFHQGSDREGAPGQGRHLRDDAGPRIHRPGLPVLRHARSPERLPASASRSPSTIRSMNMNWDQIAGNWKQFQGKVKEKWGDLTDDELDQIAGKQGPARSAGSRRGTATPARRPSARSSRPRAPGSRRHGA